MAYATYYTIAFTNNLNEAIEILLQKKDGDPDTVVQDYVARAVRYSKNNLGEGKFTTIISTEIEITIDLAITDIDYWDEFVNAEYDTWKCIATLDGKPYFDGFVLPDEGVVPFQDRPYDATIRAIDGLGLLKQTPLSGFDGEHTLISYIAFCLKQTNLELPIRIYDNVFHKSMQNRDDGWENDMFAQVKLDYRTFQKNATEFVDCYTALEIIFKRTHKIFYWNGQWVIMRIALLQYCPFVNYYTIYDKDGLNPVGYEEMEDYATVGKNELIYPINEDQIKSTAFANRSVRNTFNYVPWPELPRNNKFERGNIILPLSGPSHKAFAIDDWNYGTYSGFPSQNSALPAVTPTSAHAYRKSTYNIYGVEVEREVIMEEVTSGVRGLLISDGIPVVKGDKIDIKFDRKLSYSGVGTSQVAMIFLIADTGIKYFIESQNTSQMSPFYWHIDTGGAFISKFYDTGENFNTYTSFFIDPPEIPANGTLYIGFITTGAVGSLTYIKDFSVEYHPYIAGGFIEVKGDYWERSQNKNLPDVSDEEVFISDNDHKVFKGCMVNNSGIPFTPEWYRMGLIESRQYKDLTNLGDYNQSYRRFWKIEGSFTGTQYAPSNNQENYQPISMHKPYRFVDIAGENRQFMLLTPLEIDLIEGEFRGMFAEVVKAGLEDSQEPQTLAQFIQTIINTLNNVSPSDWTGEPVIHLWDYAANSIVVGIPKDDNMTASADDNGQGNSPSITQTYNEAINPTQRIIVFQLGTDIQPGNTFTFSAYGHDVTVTVGTVTIVDQDDGKMEGDSSVFKYVFK